MPRRHQGNKQRRSRDGKKGTEKHIRGQKAHAAAQHSGDGCRRRCRGHKNDEPHGLRHNRIPAYKKPIGKQAAGHLQDQQHDMQPVKTDGPERHAAEREQQHGHEQKGRKGGKTGKERMTECTGHNGHKQRPLLEKKKSSLHEGPLSKKHTPARDTPQRNGHPPSRA